MNSKPTLVDLFCGCGGFGLGAELAGFHSIAAIDIDRTLQSAYKNNFPNTKVINNDISKITKKDWEKILDKSDIDGVIGGPPCQGYSRMGVGDINDPRRQLLEIFFKQINILKPKFFIMENVEGLMDKKNRPQLDKAISIVDKRYKVLEPIIIDASKCGAPTTRKRVIVIGYDPIRMPELRPEQFVFNDPIVTVEDAISDIPSPIKQSKNDQDYGFSEYRYNNNLSEYAKIMRSLPPMSLGSNSAKLELSFGKVSGLFDTIHTDKVRKRYQDTPQGKIDPISKSKKLDWKGLCPTLRAGTGSDKGGHQAVRPLHPEESRVITVREAARLQGFPDWFTFHPTKWHSFRMIGNSVSPIVSQKILLVIYEALMSYNNLKESA